MRLGYLFFLGLLFLPMVAMAGDISQVVFTNDPVAIKPNEVALLTVQVQYSGTSHPTVCMKMFTSSATGHFSSSNTNWENVDKLTINSNWNNKNFYYKDSTGGSYVLSVKVMPVSCSALKDEEAQWTTSQNIVVSNEGEDTTGIIQETSEESFGVVQSDYIPPQDLPTIKAYAGKDRTMIAGALADFNGQAFGLDDKPLENARYLWNFGDGVIKEGENITHFYKYPGEYKVILEVSSGGYSVSDDVIVKVVSNEIFISEIKTGVDSFIELANPSGQEINISGWAFRNGNQSFTFSKNSFIRPRGYLVIPASASGIIFYQGNGRVELLYPGGFLADSFNYSGVVLDNQSFSRNGDGGAITPETPGAVNAKMAVLTVSAPEKISKKESELDLCPDGSVCEVKPDEKTSGQNQVANVVAVSNNNSSSNNKIYYFLGVFVLVIFSGGGIYFIRRQS